MKLKFSGDAVISGEVVYEAGKTYEVDNTLGSASMWISRGKADQVADDVVIEAPVEVVIAKPVEVVVAPVVEVPAEVAVVPAELTPAESHVLDILGGTDALPDVILTELVEEGVVSAEQVANAEVKAETKKGNKPNKGN